ncbi:MAG: FMN-binding negative transcriptional regulator [Pseudobdellovibrionaceae bacterium]
MYRPFYTSYDDQDYTLDLIREFPLGLLISTFEGRIQANYLPFMARVDENKIVLTAHAAVANVQWKNLGQEVVVTFQGPNRYISPTVYASQNNVPTWNYAAAQLRGTPEVITSSQHIKEILNESVGYFESRNGTTWKYNFPSHLANKLESAIVGIRIRCTAQIKLKLSQNRNDEDYNAVLSSLKDSSEYSDKVLCKWMSRICKNNK